MQTTGYVIANGNKVLVLARLEKYGVAMKVRKSGKDGLFFSGESDYLKNDADVAKKLIDGEVVHL